MSTYAIGDVQGCYDELQELLVKIQFNAQKDELWFVGDLVNRGHQSLEVLRFIKSLGDNAQVVLGNHDLHLLSLALHFEKEAREDTLQQVLDAPDRDELLYWLRHRPVLVYNSKLAYTMIHAGLPPQWDIETARCCAKEVESLLRSKNYCQFLKQMYGNNPNCWDENLHGYERYRFILNSFTRIRFCGHDGSLDFEYKVPVGHQPEHLLPWFKHPQRRSKGEKIIFGHWSTLVGVTNEANVFATDTGCCWGRALTAFCLENQQRYSVPSRYRRD